MKLRFELRYLRTALLILPSLLLAFAIGLEIDWGRRISLPLPQPKQQQAKLTLLPLQPEFTLAPLEQNYNDMLLLPLFVPTRRPPPPVQGPSLQSAMQKGQFSLMGVVLTKDKNLALLREIATNKIVRVEQGKEIRGIQLEKLEKRSVTLKQGDDREELMLKIAPMQAPPPHLPQPAAAAQPGVRPISPPVVSLPPVDPRADPQGLISQRRAAHGL